MLDTRFDEAVAAHRAGDLARAAPLYEAVLHHDPRRADALQLLALVAQAGGDLARARALLEAALALTPDAARAHYDLGVICTQLGDLAAATFAYEAAVLFAPDLAEAHNNLGDLYARAGRAQDALAAYGAALRADPDLPSVWANLATVLMRLERFDVAVRALETASRLAPGDAAIATALGQACLRARRPQAAVAALRRAVALAPDARDAHLLHAEAACEIDDFTTAFAANARALALDPTSAAAHCNRAGILHMTGQFDGAIGAAEAALEQRPDYAEAHVNLGLALLVTGDFARGWDEYAWVWQLPAARAAHARFDRATPWDGAPFPGRRLFIACEQGYGDAIHVARYLPAVKARGGHVTLEVAPALMPLFAGLAGVDELCLADTPAQVDTGDLYIPLMGLPRAFGTDLASIPAATPYLWAPPDRLARWRPRLEAAAGLKVGIAWAGHPGHRGDRFRSVRFEDFAALQRSGVTWFALQKGRDEQRTAHGDFVVDALGAHIVDFADTAAIVAQLDLVITVDTSLAHLAGALGTPVWTLLPFAPDWRWLLARDDSPWYPTMRLFRQPRLGDWAAVFAEVRHELAIALDRSRPAT